MKINTETIKFIDDMNRIARKSRKGIRAFSKATDWDAQLEFLMFDDENPKYLEDDIVSYPLISGCVINDFQHEILSTWTQDYSAYENAFEFAVIVFEGKNPYIAITSKEDESFLIIIKDGRWDCV